MHLTSNKARALALLCDREAAEWRGVDRSAYYTGLADRLLIHASETMARDVPAARTGDEK